jgi:uncharacterized membrane protein
MGTSMQVAASTTFGWGKSDSAPKPDLYFLPVLLFITAAALLIRLYVGSREFMDFDEWQQVFMASVPRWIDLKYELRNEAHPPVFYILLKALLAFGSGKLWYRCLAIVPGAGCVLLVGIIGRKVFRFSSVALLCAGAMALSTAAITISTEVRQYQLAIFFILVAFSSFLNILRSDAHPRLVHFAIFSVASTLALGCHYFAVLFLIPCLLIPVFIEQRTSESQAVFGSKLIQSRTWALAVSLTLPVCAFAYFYLKYIRRFHLQGHPGEEFYWRLAVNETWPTFLLRNFQNFANLFSPVQIQSRLSFLLVLAALGIGSIFVFLKSKGGEHAKYRYRAIPASFVAVIVLELMILSLAQSYPFGGLLRHQYIAGPFLLLATFSVMDDVLSLLTSGVRVALLTVVALLTASHLVVAWPTIMVYPDGPKLYSWAFNHYQSTFRQAQAVYVDHWSVIGYFMNTDNRRRHFVRGIPGIAFIDQYRMEGPGGGVDIFYDKSRYNLNLSDPMLYNSFATCLTKSGIKELTLFFFTSGDVPLTDPNSLRSTIIERADDQGLSATKVVIDHTAVYAGFILK